MIPNCTRRKNLSYFLTILLFLGSSAYVAAGCTRFSNSADTTKTKTKTTKGKTSTSNNGTNKADCPGTDIQDFKRYPGSRRTSDIVVKGENNKQSGTITYETDAKVTTAIHFFKDEAERQDWKVDEIVDTKFGQILIMSKVTRKLSVSVSRREHEDVTDVVFVYREY